MIRLLQYRPEGVPFRRLRSAVPVALSLFLAWASTQPAMARGLFHPQTFTLANGLQVVVVTDRRVPVVSHMVWYRVGAADDPEGHSGIAHLLEHLMFKGTPTVPPGEFSRTISRNGGEENAFTSYDYTAYYQDIARSRLELVMRMEADRMHNLTLTEKQVVPERQVVLEERSQRTDNDPAAILDEEMQAARFLNHPYRRPVIGWQKEIAALQTADVLRFYRRWYGPNNAILVVTGDIDAAELRPLAERTYGLNKKVEVPVRRELIEPDQRADRQVSLSDPRVRQPEWSRSFRAPSYIWGDRQRAYALQVLADILGGGATSRLYRSLVVEQGLAISASAWYDPSRRGPAELAISASPRPGVDLDRLAAAAGAIIREMATSGPSEDEVARARQRMIAEAVFARDSIGTAARILGQGLAIGQSLDDIEAWPDRIDAVTRDEVAEAAKLVLASPTVTSLLLSADGPAEPAGGSPPVPAAAPAGGAIR